MEETKRPSERLSEMLELTDQTTVRIAVASSTPLDLAKYVETSRRVQSFCSITQLLSPSGPPPQGSIHIAVQWRADVANRDFHVTQKIFDEDRSKWLYDSWICRGSKAWRTMPLWIRFDGEALDPVNQVLTTGPALAVAEAAAATGTVQSKEGSSYAVFDFDLPPSKIETWSPLWCTASSGARVRLWFTLEQGQLVKMEAGPLRVVDGQGVRLIDQAFACHDERIKIRGPRWINAEPTGDGNYRIVEGRHIDVVAHYGEEPEPLEIQFGKNTEDSVKKGGYGSEGTFVGEFLHSFYRSPKSEDEIVSFIRAVVAGGYLDDLSSQNTFAPFLAVVFSKYPDRAKEWASEIENEGARTRVMELSQSIDSLLDDPPSVANNDECWGAYFASGDKRFVDKLVETTRHASSSSNPNLMLAADTAKWSLASNAEQHPLVWGAIESAVACGREDLQELLTEEPEVFLARMKDTYKAIDAPNGEA